MRSGYIVSYDISDPKRLRAVYRTLLGFGDHIQLSVFRCELSPVELVRLKSRVDGLIKHDEDQILIIDLGPAPGRSDDCIVSLGRGYIPRERIPTVV